MNRLILSGPAAEIERFQTTCLRPQRNEEPEDVSLDFEALIPMPPEITATLDDKSDTARYRALEATGSDNWFDWRYSQWGVKWNAAHLAILNAEPELLDLTFDTPWNSPEPIFHALAAQYPQLKGFALGTDPAMEWSLFGVLAHGTYCSRCFDAAALGFLILDCTLTPELSQTSARALVQGWDTIMSSGRHTGTLTNLAAVATQQVKTEIPADIVVRLEFAEHHACAEYLLGCDTDTSDSSVAADLHFLSAEDRSRTDLDRSLIEELVAYVRDEALLGSPFTSGSLSFASQARQLVDRCPEEELRAWATVALFRPGVELDMGDAGTLRAGFAAYAGRLYAEATAHLNRRAAGLTLRVSTVAVAGA